MWSHAVQAQTAASKSSSPDALFAAAFIAAVVLALYFWYQYTQAQTRLRLGEEARRNEVASIVRQEEGRLRAQFETWKRDELDSVRKREGELARREARAILSTWKQEVEQQLRRDAANRSRAVVAGKVTEHIAPFLPEFPFNPRDARFLGTPIDFVVFDGLDAGFLRRVVLVEVKTNQSTLSSRERQVRDAVRDHRVEWLELRSSTSKDDPGQAEPAFPPEDAVAIYPCTCGQRIRLRAAHVGRMVRCPKCTSVDRSKPASRGRVKTGHHGGVAETGGRYFGGSSTRKSVWTLVRQLRGPHLSTWA